MFLDAHTFRNVVASTPLISIDLIVENLRGQILLGQRLNRPAQGYWFVPGGRIQKNETLNNAFTRLSETELGYTLFRSDAKFLGVYEHLYKDSVFGDSEVSLNTHYVVLAYHAILTTSTKIKPPKTQHEHFRWWSRDEIKSSDEVHDNTRIYIDSLY